MNDEIKNKANSNPIQTQYKPKTNPMLVRHQCGGTNPISKKKPALRRPTVLGRCVLVLSGASVGDDIDISEPLVLFPVAIEAKEQKLYESGKTAQSNMRIHAVFDRAELLAAILGNDDLEITVVGRFMSGEYFYGTDTIKLE